MRSRLAQLRKMKRFFTFVYPSILSSWRLTMTQLSGFYAIYAFFLIIKSCLFKKALLRLTPSEVVFCRRKKAET